MPRVSRRPLLLERPQHLFGSNGQLVRPSRQWHRRARSRSPGSGSWRSSRLRPSVRRVRSRTRYSVYLSLGWTGHSAAPGHEVLAETRRGVLDGARVVGSRGLVERVRDAHPRAADDLAVDEPGIDGAPNLVGARQTENPHAARLGIHFDLSDRARMGLGRVRIHGAGVGVDRTLGLEEDPPARNRPAVDKVRRRTHFGYGDRPTRRATHKDVPGPSVTRSAGAASSSSAASSNMTSRASSAAAMIALPARWVVRLAKVPVQ